MRELLSELFSEHGFKKVWDSEDKEFYASNNSNLASYFTIKYIDCTKFESNLNKIKSALDEFEKEYIGYKREYGIKHEVARSIESINEVSQLDKNTSAIYVLKISDAKILGSLKNLIYSIEESPFYFKRYVLPYSDQQLEELRKALKEKTQKTIDERMSELVENEKGYYALMDGLEPNSAYGLVVRLFSKLPFTVYKEQRMSKGKPQSLDDMLKEAIDDQLKKYDDILDNEPLSIEVLMALEDVSEVDIDKKMEQLLQEKL